MNKLCEICDTVEAKHTIQGWNVCGSNWCKYVAWQWTPKQQAPEGWDKTPTTHTEEKSSPK